jgi:exocyst complex component 4
LRLEKSLSKAVQSHYQVYASSLPQHANLTEALSRTQAVIRETKKSLRDSRDMLNGRTDANSAGAAAGKRAEMVALWHKDRALREMLKTLDTM